MKVNGKEYITIKEIANKTGKEPNAIKQWLYNHGIKPLSRDALYDLSVLAAILNAPPPGKPKSTPKKAKNPPNKNRPPKDKKS